MDEFASKQYKALLDNVLYVQFALGILIQLMSGKSIVASCEATAESVLNILFER